MLQSSACESRICCFVFLEARLIRLRLRGLLLTSSATVTTLVPCAASTCCVPGPALPVLPLGLPDLAKNKYERLKNYLASIFYLL